MDHHLCEMLKKVVVQSPGLPLGMTGFRAPNGLGRQLPSLFIICEMSEGMQVQDRSKTVQFHVVCQAVHP